MKMIQKHYDFLRSCPNWKDPEIFVDITPAINWFLSDGPGYDSQSFDSEPPIIVPPWPSVWFEYTTPLQGVKFDGLRLDVSSKRFGVNVFCERLDDQDAVIRTHMEILEEGRKSVEPAYIDKFESGNAEIIENLKSELEDIGWSVWFNLFTEFNNGRSVWLRGGAFTYARKDGSDTRIWTMFSTTDSHTEIATKLWLFDPILFSIGLLHCKNVHLDDIPVSPKVQAKREKRGIPSVTFKTLVVEPMRQQVRREAIDDPNGEQNHIKRALHIARGHFKDYRNGPGLFGKYQGLYWWDMHVRGNAEAGTVIKDYKVKR